MDELTLPNLNVRGQKSKGTSVEKIGLDPLRVELIEERIMAKVEGNDKAKKSKWTSCVDAMNKKLASFRLKLLQ